MSTSQGPIALYRQLAEEHQRLNHPQERDRFLLLAADAALTAGQRDEGERLRKQLLVQNPNHLLKPYPSMADALQSPDIQAYLQQLRRSYSPEKSELMLKTLRKDALPLAEEDVSLPLDAGRNDRTKVVTPTFKPPPIRVKEPQRPEPPKPAAGWQPLPTTPSIMPFAMADDPVRKPAPAPLPLPERTRSEPAQQNHESEPTPGHWVGAVLFVVALAVAAGAAGWALLKPFLS